MDTEQLNSSVIDEHFQNWLADLEMRHLAELTFPEVSRALRALSSAYVERRVRIAEGAALSGAGKRAAFSLFYAPLHFLLVDRIVRELPGALENVRTLVDLGCGTGAAGAAWGTNAGSRASVRLIAIDRNPWATGEAARTYRAFGLTAQTRQGDASRVAIPDDASVIAAFTMNELPDAAREALLSRLLDRARFGSAKPANRTGEGGRSSRRGHVLIVEPLAKGVARWWNQWREVVERAGGRADEWRFRMDLPPIVAKLDRAAGLNHRELTGRTLWL